MLFRNFPIDRELEYVDNTKLVTLKFIPFNDLIFDEHFPDMSIYPGSMILNVVFSTLYLFIEKLDNQSLDSKNLNLKTVKFRRPCKPGDLMKVEIKLKNKEGDIYDFFFRVDNYFQENLICNGKFTIKVG